VDRSKSRADRRKHRNRQALIEAGGVLAKKEIDATTMAEIAELADVTPAVCTATSIRRTSWPTPSSNSS
jgi:AcrR family transcriptional regulator